MKTNNIIAIMLVASLASCSQKEENIVPDPLQMTFCATQEGEPSAISKTVLTLTKDGNKVLWASGDRISVLYKSNSDTFLNDPFTLKGNGNSSKGYFTGTLQNTPGYYAAVYPYQKQLTAGTDFSSSTTDIYNVLLPADQTATAGTFDKEAALMLAPITTDTSFTFYHVCSYLKITPAFDCSSITVETVDKDECLSGLIELKYDKDGNPTSSVIQDEDSTLGVNRLILTGTISNGKSYYLALLPQKTGQLKITYRAGGNVASETKGNENTTFNRRGVKEINSTVKAAPTQQEFEMVDLGLSVKWASKNIGAASEADAGEEYAWGELVPKHAYSWHNYKWGDMTNHTSYTSEFVTKYNSADMKTTLESSDDIASVLHGGTMRIPTKAEWEELANNCNWTYDESKGGWTVTSKKNSKSIFLPISKTTAGYWSSTYSTESNYSKACYMSAASKSCSLSTYFRKNGLFIRPVAK